MRYQAKYLKPSAPVAVGSLMMRIAAVLLCLVLFSLHLTSGLYAKYTSSGKGDDSARVAKFEILAAGDPAAVSIDSKTTDNGTYRITVTNKSEVAVEYDIIINLKNTVPGVSTVLKTGDTSHAGNGDGQTVTYHNVNTLPAGTQSATHDLTFNVVDWGKFAQEKTGSSAKETLEFTVTIHVVQVD